MTDEPRSAQSQERVCANSAVTSPLDAMSVELATGLTIADVEALGSDGSPEVRAEIAVKFARQYDRLARSSANSLTSDLLIIFSKDRDRLVRRRFADNIKASPYLPPAIAARLARDEIDIATPILQASPVLEEEVIKEIIKSMPESYALTVAERRPLTEDLVNLMIECKGTKRVVVRLLDNDEADLSEAVLLRLHEWGMADPDIADRLQKRPNLPFAFVNQRLLDLADEVQWRSLGERIMTKFEATQLQTRFEGKAGHRSASSSGRLHRLRLSLKDAFERGHLKPTTLLAFLRDRDTDRLECGFVVMTGLDLRRVRALLYGSDRRGLIALCLKADFSAADYLAFRIALSLAELGATREQPSRRYPEKSMQFARDQFEKMRAEPSKLARWLPTNAT